MKQKIVTLGGGSGSLMLLTGLRKFKDVQVGTIMAMADDGGSTGRMRDEFDMPAFGGDFRDALVGLAENEELAKIFMYRFERGKELKGHSVGNLILLGLFESAKGDIGKALDIVHNVLRVRGKVYPSTTESIQLCCEYDDGSVLVGQDKIDNSYEKNGHHIARAYLTPQPEAFPEALKILHNADKIVMGPGDLYGTVIANLLVEGIAKGACKSKGKKIYIVNLMTKINNTHGFKASDFVNEIKKYLGCELDYVVVNNSPLPQEINEKYKHEQWYMVEDDLPDRVGKTKVIHDKVWLEGKEFKRVSSDVIPRSFIRHDPEKLAEIIVNL